MAPLESLVASVAAQPAALCALLLVAPFLQEDAALLTAASVAAAQDGVTEAALPLLAVLCGLTLCALCKYGLGAASSRAPVVAGLVHSRRLDAGARVLHARLGVSLLAARFVPGTRIPLYLVCGAARAPLGKFALCTALAGVAYVSAASVGLSCIDALIAGVSA